MTRTDRNVESGVRTGDDAGRPAVCRDPLMAAANTVPTESTPSLIATMLDIVEAAFHSSPSEWLFFRELRVGTRSRNGSLQRLDAFALNSLSHTAMKRVCYEMKTSRADFLCELRNPLKRRIGLLYSNEFFFVTPAGLVELAEIPAECGLIEAGLATPSQWKELFPRHAGFFSYDADSHTYCMIRIPAPWRETPGPTWQLAAAMVRNQRYAWGGKPTPPSAQRRLSFDGQAISGTAD
jgi:hypothetical protein